MKLPYAEPDPAGSERALKAKDYRDLATEVSRLQAQALTKANGEEIDHGHSVVEYDANGKVVRNTPATYPANFTKGLLHNQNGLLDQPDDYIRFVEAINSPNSTLFEKYVATAASRGVVYTCHEKTVCDKTPDVTWRGWESPRAGHSYDLEGPDAGAVGMAPAPRVGSSELAAEMAEVYALAILRDVPFTEIAAGGDARLCCEGHETAARSAADIAADLQAMAFYSGVDMASSTPGNVGEDDGLNRFERRRRHARLLSGENFLPRSLFRGSTKGAHHGSYISQFLLIGAGSRACGDGGASTYPGLNAAFDLLDGYIPYGSLVIDQRTITHKACLDYMTDWCSWLDVQNGANVTGIDQFETTRRFITTPRDLATYVHYDALYEAYLNACLIMLSLGVPKSKGFPENSPSGNRTAFATFGDPHVLSLVTEVATRCLKAVRRQKFNYHRRARPEALGGRLTLANLGSGQEMGSAEVAFAATLEELPDALLAALKDHNLAQKAKAGDRGLTCSATECAPTGVDPTTDFDDGNLLLPMAFPEGSPMHPAYGAGHATVAGGCVTMLKAFFEMFTDENGYVERQLKDGDALISVVPNADGSALVADPGEPVLTIQGELDKLAANISIGRNMAGVHYYSDYYDSLRMGERIAVGILLEQAPAYGEAMETTFTSFDGDHITISGEPGSCPTLSVLGPGGGPIDPDDWWLRHVVGRELSLDL